MKYLLKIIARIRQWWILKCPYCNNILNKKVQVDNTVELTCECGYHFSYNDSYP